MHRRIETRSLNIFLLGLKTETIRKVRKLGIDNQRDLLNWHQVVIEIEQAVGFKNFI